MSAIDILSIGEPMVEFNQTRPGEPNSLQGFGGDSSILAIAAARYANGAAALASTGFGAVAPLPRPGEVFSLLRAP